MPVPELDFQWAAVLVLFSKSYLDHIVDRGGRLWAHKLKAQPKTSSLNDDASALREPAIIRRYSSTLEKRNLGTHMRATSVSPCKPVFGFTDKLNIQRLAIGHGW